MAEYRLHCFGESGNAYKVALYLAAVGADWEAVPVDFFGGASRDPAFRAEVNVMGEFPVLEGPGAPHSQSGAMLVALARRFGRYGGADDAENDEILRWILWDGQRLTGQAATYRFLKVFGKPEQRNPEIIGWLAGRLRSAMKTVETRLTAQDYVALPDRLTVADMACAGYMFYWDEMEIDAADWPAIDAWRARVKALPNWAHPYDLMPRAASAD